MLATSHSIMLPSVYFWNLYFESQTACINTLSTSAGSRTHGRIYRQMKNKSTAQSHHTNHLWRPNILFCNHYLGLILGIIRPEGEAHHYCNKCAPAVTLPRQSLSLTHLTYKQNNLLKNIKCLILHINYSLHQKWVLLNSRSKDEDITSHFVGLPHKTS